jgi:ABC-type glycerol-3-phosphate transport system permease component
MPKGVAPAGKASGEASSSVRLPPLGIQQQYYTDYSPVMAISTIAFIPLVRMFALFQRGFIQGVALSSIKE